MAKYFNEFSKDEQNEILRLNSEILVDKYLNWDDLFDSFKTHRKEIGLDGLKMSFNKNGDIIIKDSTFCSVNVFHTVEQLIKFESGNPDIIDMLEKTKMRFDLIKDLTISLEIANIGIKDELPFINYKYNFYPTDLFKESHVLHLCEEIKKYTQYPKVCKELKKIEMQQLYGVEINFKIFDDIRSLVLEIIKFDLKDFEVYVQSKIENIKKQLQSELRVKFDNIYSLNNLKEILITKKCILFDEKNYNIITTFDSN